MSINDDHPAMAEKFAYAAYPEGCRCENNGDLCDWCMAVNDWEINDDAWRKEAMEVFNER